MHEPESVVGVEIVAEKLVGREEGFLAIRRMTLRNVHPDGSRSAPYLCDFLVRPKGIDAIVVAVYARERGRTRVLLRDGLRPALHFGRPPEVLPVPDARRYLYFREVVAGIVEASDRGEEGLRRRAAAEVEEEAGISVRAEEVVLLGRVFPTPGTMPERFWLAAVEVPADAAEGPPGGDGSPMEEGARTVWMDLEEAISACVRGDIEDAKTELVLRRLREWIDAAPPGGGPYRAPPSR